LADPGGKSVRAELSVRWGIDPHSQGKKGGKKGRAKRLSPKEKKRKQGCSEGQQKKGGERSGVFIHRKGEGGGVGRRLRVSAPNKGGGDERTVEPQSKGIKMSFHQCGERKKGKERTPPWSWEGKDQPGVEDERGPSSK